MTSLSDLSGCPLENGLYQAGVEGGARENVRCGPGEMVGQQHEGEASGHTLESESTGLADALDVGVKNRTNNDSPRPGG